MSVQIQPAGKAIIAVIVLALAVGVYFKWGRDAIAKRSAGVEATETTKTVAVTDANGKPVINKDTGLPETKTVTVPVAASAGPATGSCGGKGERACKVALSQWPGHSAGILACGGLTPQPGSFCTTVTSAIKPNAAPGLNVEFIFIEEPDKKNAALQSGEADFIWTTTDEMPINLPGYAKSGVEAVSFVQIDWSRGGDACVADKSVTMPRDMLTPKGAVLQYSPDHTVFAFWLTNGDLTPAEVVKARANMSFSMDDYTYARNLFCQGKIDVACLWEPDVSLALACRPGAYRVFSTKDADTLVADNLLGRKDFLEAHPDVAEKIARIFLEGGRIGNADKKGAAKLISTVEPRFRDELKYEATLASLDWVRWNDLGDNVAYFGLDGTPAKFDAVYKQADTIWSEYTEPDGTPALPQRFTASKLRTPAIIKAIYESEKKVRADVAQATGKVAAPIEAEKPVYKPEVIATATAKIIKPVTINFDSGKTELDIGARAILKAQVLSQVDLAEGMGLRIEGNTDDTGSATANKALSAKRAQAVKDFLVSQGLEADRVVAVGNGPDNPTCNAKTPDCRAANRRTDIVFVTGN